MTAGQFFFLLNNVTVHVGSQVEELSELCAYYFPVKGLFTWFAVLNNRSMSQGHERTKTVLHSKAGSNMFTTFKWNNMHVRSD